MMAGPMLVKLKPVPTRVPMLKPCKAGVESRSGPELKSNLKLTAWYLSVSMSQSSMMSPVNPDMGFPNLSLMRLLFVSRTSTAMVAEEVVSASMESTP